jgi:hypothetical protein
MELSKCCKANAHPQIADHNNDVIFTGEWFCDNCGMVCETIEQQNKLTVQEVLRNVCLSLGVNLSTLSKVAAIDAMKQFALQQTSALQAEYNKLEAETNSYADELVELKEEHSELQTELNEANQEAHEWHVKHDDLFDEALIIKTELDKAKKDNEEWKKYYDETINRKM